MVWLILSLAACATSDYVEFSDLEGKIPQRFFDSINTYKVSQDWLTRELGKPDIVQNGNRDQEIFTYIFQEHSYTVRKFIPVYRKGEAKHAQIFMHFVFVDEKLQSYWRDDKATVELNTMPVKTKILHDEIVTNPSS